MAVKDLWLDVSPGECFGFLGLNGAGKTTTIRCLTGEDVPTAGTAKLKGLDILTSVDEIRRLMGSFFCLVLLCFCVSGFVGVCLCGVCELMLVMLIVVCLCRLLPAVRRADRDTHCTRAHRAVRSHQGPSPSHSCHTRTYTHTQTHTRSNIHTGSARVRRAAVSRKPHRQAVAHRVRVEALRRVFRGQQTQAVRGHRADWWPAVHVP